MPERVGDRLGNYAIEKELFRSNNGAVYRVRRRAGSGPKNVPLCIKERRVSELGRQKDILNEVKLLERVRHPCVVSCEGYFFDNVVGIQKSLFIVLEVERERERERELNVHTC